MKRAALGVLSLRMAYGAALLVAPDRLVRSWLGPADDPLRVALRSLGARELAVHGAGLAAVITGADVRPWLAVSLAGDVSDIAATIAGRGGLPAGSPAKTAAVAGASAALTAALFAGSASS